MTNFLRQFLARRTVHLKPIRLPGILVFLLCLQTGYVAYAQDSNDGDAEATEGIRRLSTEAGENEGEEEVFELSPFEVTTNNQRGYLQTNAVTASKIGLAIKNVPLNTQVMTSEFLEDTGTTRFSDIVNYSSSFTGDSANADNFNSTITRNNASFGTRTLNPDQQQNTGRIGVNPFNAVRLRAFPIDVILRNGLPRPGGNHSLKNVDRVEIVKGPVAIFFGQSQPGGAINYMTKRPVPGRHVELKYRTGSFNQNESELVYNDNIGKWLGYRLVGSWTDNDGWRDYTGISEKFYAAVIQVRPLKSLVVNLEYEYLDTFSRPGGSTVMTNPQYHADYFNPPEQLLRAKGTTWEWNESRVDENGKPRRPLNYEQSLRRFREVIFQNREAWMQGRYIAYGEYPYKITQYGLAGTEELVDPAIIDMDFDNPVVDLRKPSSNLTGPDSYLKDVSKVGYIDINYTPATWIAFKVAGNMYEADHTGMQAVANFPNADLTFVGDAVYNGIDFYDGYTVQADTVLTLERWGMTNRLILGGEFRQRDQQGRGFGNNWAPYVEDYREWNWTKLEHAPYFEIYRPDDPYKKNIGQGLGPINRYERIGYYAMHQGTYLKERLHTMAGVRYESQENTSWNPERPGIPTEKTGEASGTSWMVGAVYDTGRGVSIYGSYNQNYRPNSQWSIIAGDTADLTAEEWATREYLDDETGKGIDFGLKLDMLEERISGQVSYFVIQREGLVRRDYERSKANPLNDQLPGDVWRVQYMTNDGKHQAKGIELEIFAFPLQSRQWQIVFGYTHYFETGLVSDPSLSPVEAERLFARPLDNVAKDSMTLWSNYKFEEGMFLEGFSFGLGVRYASETLPLANEWTYDIINPAYTVFDANIRYNFRLWDTDTAALLHKADYSLSLNINNLTDELYSQGGVAFAPPRSWSLGLTVRF